MTITEDSTITISLAVLVLTLVWMIANKLARATARMDAAEERDAIRKADIEDHEARIRIIENNQVNVQRRRRATDK